MRRAIDILAANDEYLLRRYEMEQQEIDELIDYLLASGFEPNDAAYVAALTLSGKKQETLIEWLDDKHRLR